MDGQTVNGLTMHEGMPVSYDSTKYAVEIFYSSKSLMSLISSVPTSAR